MSTFLALMVGTAFGYYVLTEIAASMRKAKRRIRKLTNPPQAKRSTARRRATPDTKIVIIRVP